MAVARDSDVAFVFVFVEEIIVEVIEPEEGCLGELGKFASFFLSGASKSFLTIDEAAYFHHFKQFELVAAGDIFQIVGHELCSHAVFNQPQYLK